MVAMDERELYESFEKELATVSGLARYKASKAHVEDVEVALAEWKVRCWRVYPRLAREVEEDRRLGRRCRHNVKGYLARVMGNMLVDGHRRAKARGQVSDRDGQTRVTVYPDSEQVDVGGQPGETLGMGMDGITDEEGADPVDEVVRAEESEVLWAGMAGSRRMSGRRWWDGWTDGERARWRRRRGFPRRRCGGGGSGGSSVCGGCSRRRGGRSNGRRSGNCGDERGDGGSRSFGGMTDGTVVMAGMGRRRGEGKACHGVWK